MTQTFCTTSTKVLFIYLIGVLAVAKNILLIWHWPGGRKADRATKQSTIIHMLLKNFPMHGLKGSQYEMGLNSVVNVLTTLEKVYVLWRPDKYRFYKKKNEKKKNS